MINSRVETHKYNRPAADRVMKIPLPAADRKICFSSVRMPAPPPQIRGITDAGGSALTSAPDAPVSR